MITYQRGSDEFQRIREFNSDSCVKFGKVRLLGFPRANLKQLLGYIDVNLENSNLDTIRIHLGTNDLLNGGIESQIDSLVQKIGMIILKCQLYGKKNYFFLEETYKRFEEFCRNNGVILIDNRNIRDHHLYRDGLHLSESRKKS